MRLFEKFTNPLANLSTAYQTLKIVTFILLVVVIGLTVSLIITLNKEQIVVGVNKQGVPIPMEIKDKRVENMINYKQFITYFLNSVYDWNSDTYIDQIEKALPLMAEDIRGDYIQEMKKGGYIETIKKNQITSSIQVKKILTDKAKKYKDGYLVKVQAVKLRVTDFIDRTSPVKIKIAFRPVDISSKNIWGLEVFEIKEIPID